MHLFELNTQILVILDPFVIKKKHARIVVLGIFCVDQVRKT